jgi:maltose phosphorylase
MIKQPDVLMFMFLYNQRFDLETKKANYDYYEPITIHESSLSPSIHSILAAELGYMKEAVDFFGFATRMDLDDYNRNTKEGLHLTSIAAAWVNIVYGFGGLRSDGDMLKLAPYCPEYWTSYQFNFHYFGSNIKVFVTRDQIKLTLDRDLNEEIMIYHQIYHLKKGTITIHVAH